MGMFDDVKCYYPLPSDYAWANTLNYQTKDFKCFLDLYEIRHDGTLWRTPSGWGKQGKPHKIRFTGIFNFYASLYSKSNSGWIEWRVWYDKGKLIKICLVDYVPRRD